MSEFEHDWKFDRLETIRPDGRYDNQEDVTVYRRTVCVDEEQPVYLVIDEMGELNDWSADLMESLFKSANQ